MSKNHRLDIIVKTLCDSDQPVSGTKLAKICDVSRQVIVQDIALLRAKDIDIISTSKGYIILDHDVKREIYVCHTDEMIEDELNTIVDLGGKVENVFVDHAIYGRIEANLNIHSRKDVKIFMNETALKKIKPLTELTGGKHGHLVCASSEFILDEIEEALAKMNILSKKDE